MSDDPNLTNAGQYISWVANGKLAWTLQQSIMGPDNVVGISGRPIPQEPMVSLRDRSSTPLPYRVDVHPRSTSS